MPSGVTERSVKAAQRRPMYTRTEFVTVESRANLRTNVQTGVIESNGDPDT